MEYGSVKLIDITRRYAVRDLNLNGLCRKGVNIERHVAAAVILIH